MLAVTVYGDDAKTPLDWRLCLVPKSDYEIIDTWQAMGMVGTGSKDIAVTERFVPERRALPLTRCRAGSTHPGAALNSGRSSGFPWWPRPVIPSARPRSAPRRAPTTSSSRAWPSARARIRARRSPTSRPCKSRWRGRGVSSTRPAISCGSRPSSSSARRRRRGAGPRDQAALPRPLRLRRQPGARGGRDTWSCYGANGIYTRDPLQRHLRDVLAINQHFSFNFDIAGAAYGLVALARHFASPTM